MPFGQSLRTVSFQLADAGARAGDGRAVEGRGERCRTAAAGTGDEAARRETLVTGHSLSSSPSAGQIAAMRRATSGVTAGLWTTVPASPSLR